MALFKIISKKTGSFSVVIQLEKGMSGDIIDNNNPLSKTKGIEKVRLAIENKINGQKKMY